MTKILRSTDANNAGSATITQAQFQAQAQAQVDGLRQLVGNADIAAGATLTSSLNSPITLYVDPNIGADDWEGGSYNTNAASRIENQQLATGYSPNRPFRTLNRAVIEAAILTSKSYLSAVGDLVTIFCAPGQHTLLNGAGDSDTTNITAWGTSKADTKDASWNTLLTRFNDPNWGIILPRGVTICGWDLRKTVIRPAVVPAASGFSRRRMLRVTSDCYFFGFSFKDAIGVTTSHHNLACFGFAGQTALDLFYQKIRAAFPDATTSSNLDAAKAITLNKEYEIVGPQPDSPSIDSDTTNGSSPYIFNCSLRSQYGLCGIDIDGSVVTGIKSLVTAQFTNVSLQKDIAAFQKYDGSNWVDLVDYNDYINTDINNLRFKVTDSADYRHFALKATNNAFMQAVSIFAIGNAVHHWCESGGEITLTNSNSNFGGVASLSLGFRGQGKSGGAFPQDTNFTASYIRRAKAIPTDGSNIRRIFLGTVSSVTNTQITLTTALDYAGLLTKNQYSLKAGDYIWIENNNNGILAGADFKAQLASSPWSSSSPTQIAVQNNGNSNFGGTGVAAAAPGNRVYIRRLVDSRSPEERETSFIVQNTGTCRRPQGSYVIRMDVNGNLTSAASSTQLDPANGGGEVFLVGDSNTVTTTKAGTTLNATSFKVVAVSGDSQRIFSSSTDNFYRTAEVVVYQNRYYRSISNQTATSWDATQWRQTLRDIPVRASAGGIEAARSNVAPQIILDGDTDSSETSTTLGWDLSAGGSTIYTNQLRSGADYRALRNLMLKLGYAAGTGAAQVDGILHPVAETSRDYDIVTGAIPSGGKLSSRAAWPLEFNRPSIIRAFGLAYEWVGYGNYSKSLPKYQVFRLNDQQGLDVLAANIGGGRCFNQGTTEEGLIVTPFTIQDLGTGRGFSTDTAGLGGISGDVEFPTTFQNLTVTNTLSAQTYVGLPASTTDRDGIGQIASISDITGAVQRTTDAELNQAGARFITPEGLEYWRIQNRLVSQRTGTTNFFIVPDSASSTPISANNYGTYSFNGTNYTLTLDPRRTGGALTGNQAPNDPTRAVTFATAVDLANSILATTETASYYLANGRYWTAVSFNHIANVIGAVNQFPNSNDINPNFVSGGAPTTAVKTIYDNYSIPTFGARIYSVLSTFANTSQLIGNTAFLFFKQGGSVNGISFVGMDKLISDTTNWPDSLFDAGSAYRSNSGNVVAAYANSWYQANGGSTVFYHYYQVPRIYVQNGTVSIRNIISGPGFPGRGGRGSGLDSSLVDVKNGYVSLSGIYLLGCVKVAPSDLPNITSLLKDNVTGCQHLQALISGYESDNTMVGVKFPYVYGTNPTPTTNIYNYDVNCIHILDASGNYATAANKQSATYTLRGAAFRSIIGVLAAGTKLMTGGYDSYRTQAVPANGHHGFLGVFGCRIDYESDSNGVDRSPLSITFSNSIDTEREPSYVTYLFQQGRTGTGLTSTLSTTSGNAANADTTTTNQTGGIYWAYSTSAVVDNILNVNTFTWLRGINTTSGGRNRTTFYG